MPGHVTMLGPANSNATVSLWGDNGAFVRASRRGEYFQGELPVNNSTGAVWLTITNLGVLTNGVNADTVASVTGTEFIAKTPESFTYDADGNLASDGRWTYNWDAENRLVSMVSLSTGPFGSRLKLDFSYDYQGRRIQKIVSAWNGTNYAPAITNSFVYDGWNLLTVLDARASVVQSFLWGLDLSGSTDGAGGVGGLLAVSDVINGAHFAIFDANGNVTAVVNLWAGFCQLYR